MRTRKIDVGIHGKAHAGTNVALVRHRLPRKAAGEPQPKPLLDPAFLAFGAVVVLALELTFTLGKQIWPSDELLREEEALMEVLPVAENLDFFKTMDVLDNLDVLEFMVNAGPA